MAILAHPGYLPDIQSGRRRKTWSIAKGGETSGGNVRADGISREWMTLK